VDPTDADVEAVLRAAPAERWDSLAAAVAAVEAAPPGGHVTWAGGERLADGSTSMPYPVYGEEVERLRGALGGVGAVVVFAWPEWLRGREWDAESVATAPVADAARLVTALLRAERFGEGTIAANLDLLLGAARRLLAWRR
jgi:hypothetical protein